MAAGEMLRQSRQHQSKYHLAIYIWPAVLLLVQGFCERAVPTLRLWGESCSQCEDLEGVVGGASGRNLCLAVFRWIYSVLALSSQEMPFSGRGIPDLTLHP